MLTAIVAVLLCLQAPSGERVSSPAPDSGAQRRAVLNDIATHRSSPDPAVLLAVLRAGLEDPDPAIRLTAVSALAGRAARARFGRSPEDLTQWRHDRSTVLSLRPIAMSLLSDRDDKVRVGAIVALVNIEFDPETASREVWLGNDLSLALANMIGPNTNGSVRAEVVKTFALTESHPATRERVLTQALGDPAPDVLAPALAGMARVRPPSALPTVVLLARHPAVSVRMQASQALAAYGEAVRPYLEQLSHAIASENDDRVRTTLEAVVDALRRGRPSGRHDASTLTPR
jgi:hypothetical protein